MRKTFIILLTMLSLAVSAQDIPYFQPYGPNYWYLHKGLNIQLDLGATVGFGRNNPFRHGAFHTDLSALYMDKVTDRLSYAAGITLSHLRVQGTSYVTASLGGVLAYKFTDRLTGLAFASMTTSLSGDDSRRMMYQGSIFPYYSPYYAAMYAPGGLAPYAMPGMTIGGGVDYKIAEGFHVGVSCTWQMPVSAFGSDSRRWINNGQVDYPVPKD